MKALAKGLLGLGCRVLALPTVLGYGVASRFLGADKAFHGASQGMSLWPGLLGEYVRREFYRMTLEECSGDCCLSFGVVLSSDGDRRVATSVSGPSQEAPTIGIQLARQLLAEGADELISQARD